MTTTARWRNRARPWSSPEWLHWWHPYPVLAVERRVALLKLGRSAWCNQWQPRKLEMTSVAHRSKHGNATIMFLPAGAI